MNNLKNSLLPKIKFYTFSRFKRPIFSRFYDNYDT